MRGSRPHSHLSAFACENHAELIDRFPPARRVVICPDAWVSRIVDVVGAGKGTDACCPIRECSDRWPSARVSAVSLALRGCGAWGCFTDLPIALFVLTPTVH